MKRIFIGSFFFISIQQIVASDLMLNPRVESISATKEKPLSERFSIKASWNKAFSEQRVFLETLAEADTQQTFAPHNQKHLRAFMEEAYWEYSTDSFSTRAGMQSLRWSESWSLPSLDLWSGRRWNRYFVEDVSDQLIHPIGLLNRYTSGNFETEFFLSPQKNIPYVFPEDLSSFDVQRKWGLAAGIRENIKWAGFNIHPLIAHLDSKNKYGMSASYAFDYFVPKIEFGLESERGPLQSSDSFNTIGSDIFISQWSFFPQLTWYRSKTLSSNLTKISSCWILRYNQEPQDFEAQLFLTEQDKNLFASLRYGWTIREIYKLSAFVQKYRSDAIFSLFRYYEDHTKDLLLGLRFEAFFGIL